MSTPASTPSLTSRCTRPQLPFSRAVRQRGLLAESLRRDGLFPHPELLVTFLDNHDTPRFAAVPGVTTKLLKMAVAFLLTTRGIPQITWGDELGLPGHMDDRRDFPGGFPGDRAMPSSPRVVPP